VIVAALKLLQSETRISGETRVWLYVGAWNSFKSDCENLYEFFMNDYEFRSKVRAFKLHISQDPPVVGGTNPRSFGERIYDQSLDE